MHVIDEDGNVLEHYGVMGMRWGVRKNSTIKSTRTFRDRKTGEKVHRYDKKSAFRDLIEKGAQAAAASGVMSLAFSVALGRSRQQATKLAVRSAITAFGVRSVLKVASTVETD